ncbi:uncharacterized protein BT62DRAFT_998086 [Guyanagaster necrorhizus]|uniref:Uncharacterized protein n=1 Tax=Guyanagaster necrorhizus TaxID=856835 RepID=A0A9P7VFP1_9AGAR|nr:uncharacterized protein BT62DRAFT_998086 [Guyanagaster necrorhizus MCA 3950]KAG7439854.1 hypothetical protein BT62DRAFT_998086 [Guyanagaster necrorhizus MCA 3950]
MAGLCWILPPYFSQLVFPARDMLRPSGRRRADMQVVCNAMVMHKDLIPYFLDNAFSVDIHDNYRNIFFREMGSTRRLLPPTYREGDIFGRRRNDFECQCCWKDRQLLMSNATMMKSVLPIRLGTSSGGVKKED